MTTQSVALAIRLFGWTLLFAALAYTIYLAAGVVSQPVGIILGLVVFGLAMLLVSGTIGREVNEG